LFMWSAALPGESVFGRAPAQAREETRQGCGGCIANSRGAGTLAREMSAPSGNYLATISVRRLIADARRRTRVSAPHELYIV